MQVTAKKLVSESIKSSIRTRPEYYVTVARMETLLQ